MRKSGYFPTTMALAMGASVLLAPFARAGKAPDAVYTPRPAGTLTFNKDIAPIVFQNCSSCHRQGEVAPFALMNYDDVKKRAKTIVQVTQKRFMPPWKPEAGFGDFHDARVLSPDQIGMVKQWFDEGMKEGGSIDLPASPKFPDGWTLGEPDMVLEPKESFELSAEGRDVYRCFVVPSGITQDKYVAAVEVRPGNRKVVHHVIAYVDTSGKARELDARDPGPGYTSFGGVGFAPSGSLGGWVPGNFPRLLNDGVGISMPKGADVVLQVHYHKSGKVESDRTKIGIYFCKKPVEKIMRIFPVAFRQIRIQPGDSNYVARASLQVPAGIHVVRILPHMHLLGKEMTVMATLPDGAEKPLIRINDWDFNWQGTYEFKEPVALPIGSRINVMARYDNSANNPNNPSDPPRLVTRGEQTTDEMCIAFVYYTVDAESVSKGRLALKAPNRF